MKPLIMAVLLAWLALTFVLGISGAFITPIGEIPYRIAIGILAPVIVFVAAYWLSAHFRTVVLASDLSPNCGGTLTILAAILDPTAIAKILTHLSLPIRAPPRAPARHFALLQTA